MINSLSIFYITCNQKKNHNSIFLALRWLFPYFKLLFIFFRLYLLLLFLPDSLLPFSSSERFMYQFCAYFYSLFCYFHSILLLLLYHSLNDNNFVRILLICLCFIFSKKEKKNFFIFLNDPLFYQICIWLHIY